MAGNSVTNALKVNVNRRVHRSKDPAMPGRAKPNHGRLDAFQSEDRLNFAMFFEVVTFVANTVQDVKLDGASAPSKKKR